MPRDAVFVASEPLDGWLTQMRSRLRSEARSAYPGDDATEAELARVAKPLGIRFLVGCPRVPAGLTGLVVHIEDKGETPRAVPEIPGRELRLGLRAVLSIEGDAALLQFKTSSAEQRLGQIKGNTVLAEFPRNVVRGQVDQWVENVRLHAQRLEARINGFWNAATVGMVLDYWADKRRIKREQAQAREKEERRLHLLGLPLAG